MEYDMKITFSFMIATFVSTTLLVATARGQGQPQPVVPGTGQVITTVGDDFEDPAWSYQTNLPKVFNNKDHALSENLPLGVSANGRWYEGIKRGQPDVVRRVDTPPNGLPGSTGALALRSLTTGSARPGYQQQQDDFIANVMGLHGAIPASQTPSVVTRVWLPPIDEWENRSGCHFAFRIALETDLNVRSRGIARSSDFDGSYWPGMFIQMESREGRGATGRENDGVYIWMKASDDGKVIRGPQITMTGWWTLGMSVTPDGRVHYYARPGVEDLSEGDLVASAWPFGYRALRFRSFFFNVCNGDDGKTWSTEFVVDDSHVFVATGTNVKFASQK
jgi:hypothetical protein